MKYSVNNPTNEAIILHDFGATSCHEEDSMHQLLGVFLSGRVPHLAFDITYK